MPVMTLPPGSHPHDGGQATVEITSEGRGGSIFHLEDGQRVQFSWEFAMPPAIALVFGPGRAAFDSAERRAEVYATVGREVVRQQCPGGRFSVDLGRSMIEILR